LNNKQFIQFLERNLPKSQDILFASQDTQVGKTKLMIYCAWFYRFTYNINVVIAVNQRADISQLKNRLDNINETIKSLCPDGNSFVLKYVSSTKDKDVLNALRMKDILIVIHNESRLSTLTKTINDYLSDQQIVYIDDEADMAISSCDDIDLSGKQIQFNNLLNTRIRNVIGVTATPLACWNTKTKSLRPQLYKQLPCDLYKGKQYRDTFNDTHEFVTLEYLNSINKWKEDEKNQKKMKKDKAEFIKLIKDIVAKKRGTHPVPDYNATQKIPVILINFSYTNDHKDELCELLLKDKALRNCEIATFTGNGIETHCRSRRKVVKGKAEESYIGSFLKRLQKESLDEEEDDEEGELDAVILIATIKANRSQTYRADEIKPRLSQWKLTHYVYISAKSSHQERNIQSMRMNGQYDPLDPGCIIYLTDFSLSELRIAYHNKNLLSEKINENQQPRQSLVNTCLLESKIHASRPNIIKNLTKQKFTGNVDGLCDCDNSFCTDACKALIKRHVEKIFDKVESEPLQDIDIKELTTLLFVPKSEIDKVSKLDYSEPTPLVKLPTEKRKELRKSIFAFIKQAYPRLPLNYVIDGKTKNKSLQMAYDKERAEKLNAFNKTENYYATLIFSPPTNVGNNLPVVYYHDDGDDYIDPTDTPDDPTLYLWHHTSGKYQYRLALPDDQEMPKQCFYKYK
jgi:hypothetical protein